MRGTIRQCGKINKSWQISLYTGGIVDGKRVRYYEVVKDISKAQKSTQ